MPLPDSYIAALTHLGRVSQVYRARTGHTAVLVGGAATAIYTAGMFPSGDFDVVAAGDAEFDAVMVEHGVIKEHRPGRLLIGFYHPDHPEYGFQQVRGPLFDGRSDRNRLMPFAVTADSAVVLPPIEDLIADRLGQHAVASKTDDSRLRQARELFTLAETLDTHDLSRRTCDEGGDPTLLGL